MALTPSTITSLASDYDRTHPFAAVEAEHRTILPDALAAGEFGWREAEWVVQWYYRRFLGTYPDQERRTREAAYGENTYADVAVALEDAATATTVDAKFDALTTLSGVDVPVASAFLQFLHPDAYVVLSEREWSVLARTDELATPFPDPPAVPDYERYRDACHALADRADVDLWTVSKAIWQQWATTAGALDA